jgi:adenylate cyclase
MFQRLSRQDGVTSGKKLHTFLIADISGYSTLTELDGDEAAADIAINFACEVARLAAEHGAEVVKTLGDAAMVRCDDAADAIELGLHLHRDSGQDGVLPALHAGIHTGPAVARAGDWWGSTVNVASRVAAAAEAGQLLVTEAAKRAAGTPSRHRLRDIGPLFLKNISAPVRVYAPVAEAAERPDAPVLVQAAA